ncbi:MAG: adenylate/guanylate cyclase domain-containing protein [Acidimicrobiales bacterium]
MASLQPAIVRRWLATDDAARSQTVTGTVISADISGFTRLAEQLSGLGVRRAAEALNNTINRCFEPMIEELAARGGDVLKFGGDAIFALFEGPDSAPQACMAASAMMRVLETVDLGIDTTLSMSVGVAYGEVPLVLAGTSRRELIVRGSLVDECLRLESEAEPGEVLLSPATAAAVPDNWYSSPEPDVMALENLSTVELAPPTSALSTPSAETIDWTTVVGADLAAAVDAYADSAGEIRIVTTGFVNLPTKLLDDDTICAVVERAIDLCAVYGTTLLGTDVSPGGLKLLFSAGAPVAGDGDEDAMLTMTSELVLDPDAPPMRAGVNRGLVYVGFLGSARCRTLTVMGDPINLAARLLGKAEDRSVAVSQAVLDHARSQYQTTELAPVLVKGRLEPVTVHRLGAVNERSQQRGLSPRFVGRSRELQVLDSAVASARQGKGSAIELVGEAGVGVSRLVEQFLSTLPVGVLRFQLPARIATRSTPFRAVRSFLRSMAAIDDDASAEQAGLQLAAWVERVGPEFAEHSALIAPAFGADLPLSEADESTLPEFRQLLVNESIVGLLARTLTVPAVVVAEDLQWVDPASRALLAALAGHCSDRPWVVVATRRPGGESLFADLIDADAGGDAVDGLVVSLEPLSLGEVLSVVEEVGDLPDELRRQIAGRSGGNPLFAVELAAAAQSGDAAGVGFESIEGLITARIDRLGHSARILIRTAAVFGEHFDTELLRELVDLLASVEEKPLITSDAPAPESLGDLIDIGDSTTTFRSAIVRDVAYEGLSVRRRRELHGLAAEVLEGRGADITELAWHHAMADNHEQCWIYSRRAGDRAAQLGLVNEATDHLSRAIAAVDQAAPSGFAPAQAFVEALVELFDIGVAAKRYSEALTAGERALELLTDRLDRIELLVRVAVTKAETDGSYPQQMAWLTRELEACGPGLDDAEARAWLGGTLAGLYYRFDTADRALAAADEALADARQAGQTRAVPPALLIRHAALNDQADPQRMAVGLELIAAAEDAGDIRILGAAHCNVGLDLQDGGDWSGAADHYNLGIKYADELGDGYRKLFPTINLAAMQVDQGRWDEARPILDEARRTAQHHRSGYTAAWAKSELGRLEVVAGRPTVGRPLLESALEWFTEAEIASDVFELRVLLLAADLAEGRSAPVLEGVEQIDPPDDVAKRLLGRLDTIAGYAYLQRGQPEEGLELLVKAVAVTDGPFLFGHALALVGRSEAEHFLGRARASRATRAFADEVLTSLGVVALPVIPLPR